MRPTHAIVLCAVVFALAACDGTTSERSTTVPPPAATCEPAPAGTVDPMPFKAGDVVRFALHMTEHSDFTRQRRSGTVTWTVESASCTSTGRTLVLTEAEASSDTLQSYNPNTGEATSQSVTPISRTKRITVVLPTSGTLPQVGMYAFKGLGQSDLPPRFFPNGSYQYDYYPGFRTSGRTTASADAGGFLRFDQSVRSTSPTHSWWLSLVRTP